MIPLTLPTPWPAVAAAVIIAGAGFAGGYALKGRLDAAAIERLRGDIARLEAAHATEKRAAAEEAARRLAQAQARADEAAARAARLQTRLEEEQNRVESQLYTLADRPCLGARALGLLDQSPGLGLALPQAPGEPLGPAAGTPADPGASATGPDAYASERDIALWMSEAAALYETCRARIDALRQWADTHD